MIMAERERQISQEGWTPEHDDNHGNGELAIAAACYARFAADTAYLGGNATRRLSPPKDWPWDHEWWKPHASIHDLVRAGALIAAEIDRLRRASMKFNHPPATN